VGRAHVLLKAAWVDHGTHILHAFGSIAADSVTAAAEAALAWLALQDATSPLPVARWLRLNPRRRVQWTLPMLATWRAEGAKVALDLHDDLIGLASIPWIFVMAPNGVVVESANAPCLAAMPLSALRSELPWLALQDATLLVADGHTRWRG